MLFDLIWIGLYFIAILFAATMLCKPWEGDWLQEFSDPAELRRWVDPLWREELELGRTGEQFSGRPCRDWDERESD